MRCLGGVSKGWGLWLRKFRAHDFQVNARGWRLGGLPCTIVAVHGSNSAPTFPFTFKTRGVWFEPPDKICAKDGENLTPIPQTLARIRARLDYPLPGPCATDASRPLFPFTSIIQRARAVAPSLGQPRAQMHRADQQIKCPPCAAFAGDAPNQGGFSLTCDTTREVSEKPPWFGGISAKMRLSADFG